eukprot:6192467-Pleurochrysis_carterae.AAC.2
MSCAVAKEGDTESENEMEVDHVETRGRETGHRGRAAIESRWDELTTRALHGNGSARQRHCRAPPTGQV